QVWKNWEKIKQSEKEGTDRHRQSALDGIPRYLPALMQAQKLIKKARKAGLASGVATREKTRQQIAAELFHLVELCQNRDWSAEDLLRQSIRGHDRQWRKEESVRNSQQ